VRSISWKKSILSWYIHEYHSTTAG